MAAGVRFIPQPEPAWQAFGGGCQPALASRGRPGKLAPMRSLLQGGAAAPAVALLLQAALAGAQTGSADGAWSRRSIYNVAPPARTDATAAARSGRDALNSLYPPTSTNTVLQPLPFQSSFVDLGDQPAPTGSLEDVDFKLAALSLSQAEEILKLGRVDEAVKKLLTALDSAKADVTRGFLASRIGSYEFRQRQYTSAVKYMRIAANYRPGDAGVICNLAACLVSVGELDEAIYLLESINDAFIHDAKMLFSINFNRACAYSLKGRKDDSLRCLVEAAKWDSASVLASLGDPQLDGVRHEKSFQTIIDNLESLVQGKPRKMY